jgi:hypothetical protein
MSDTRAKKKTPRRRRTRHLLAWDGARNRDRLRVGRAIAKTEEEVAPELMKQIKERGHQQTPPAIATDGKGAYREAMVETWGKVPEPKPSGKGFVPEKKPPATRLALPASHQASRTRPRR